MPALAAQPALENPQEHLGVETIGPAVFARHRNARRMDEVGLDAADAQPARQPEPVAS
jgi:hypothetical protein